LFDQLGFDVVINPEGSEGQSFDKKREGKKATSGSSTSISLRQHGRDFKPQKGDWPPLNP
jgi:hypothetical protein